MLICLSDCQFKYVVYLFFLKTDCASVSIYKKGNICYEISDYQNYM